MYKLFVVIAAAVVLCMAALGVEGSRKNIQVVDLYVCDAGIIAAELHAKASVSRKELYVVSHCTCEGVNSDMKKAVKTSSCEAPRNNVYSCICVGKSTY
jgi:hypothetical protein